MSDRDDLPPFQTPAEGTPIYQAPADRSGTVYRPPSADGRPAVARTVELVEDVNGVPLGVAVTEHAGVWCDPSQWRDEDGDEDDATGEPPTIDHRGKESDA